MNQKMNKLVRWKLPIWLSLFFFCCAFSAAAQEKGITIHVENVSLKEVLHAIEQQTSYRFSYRNVVVDSVKNITVSKTDAKVSAVLDEVLAGKNLTYNIISPKSIVITDLPIPDNRKKESIKNYSGTVTDEKGEAIIEASVSIKGNKAGTITDIDGRFSIQAPAGSTLLVSYLGFAPKEVKLGNRLDLQIIISEDDKLLDEVVVVGYGVQNKRDVSTSISQIKADQLIDIPISDFRQALAGKMAGVQVLQSSGDPEGTVYIRIRGVSSATAGNEPLYVIDGVPIERGFANLNNNDIESVEVLKDASAAAIYGSRGSNGVINSSCYVI
jgi:TonB-dependent SusC/RagA subfamily outer membrane receptor